MQHTANSKSPPGTPKQQAASTSPHVNLAFGSPFQAAEEGDGGVIPPAIETAHTSTAAASGVAVGPSTVDGLQHHRRRAASDALLPGLATIRTVRQHAGSRDFNGLTPAASSRRISAAPEPAWGWLQPGRPGLPYTLLRGKGVGIGRGKEAYEERLPLLLLGSPPPTPTSAPDPGSRRCFSSEGLEGGLRGGGDSGRRQKASTFVDVADGRVSRLHCWVTRGHGGEGAVLQDCSSNGTFLNGEKVPRGRPVPIHEGDRISLVRSVAPLAEQFFVYHHGDPRTQDPESVADWIEAASKAWVATPASTLTCRSPTVGFADGLSSPRHMSASRTHLKRSKTSTYATAEAITLDDLQCQICLGTLQACVALEPCGHCFCAPCLSHHLASLLTTGQPLACPFRCSAPERVVPNWDVRRLVEVPAAASTAATLPPLTTLVEMPSGGESMYGEAYGDVLGGALEAGSATYAQQDKQQQQVEANGDAGEASGDAGEASGDAGEASGDAGEASGDAGEASGDAGAPSTRCSYEIEQALSVQGLSPPGSPAPIELQWSRVFSLPATSAAASVPPSPHSPAAWEPEWRQLGGGGAPLLHPPAAPEGRGVWAGAEDGEQEEELRMNLLCPLYDELLPLDVSRLKHTQLSYSVDLLRQSQGAVAVLGALEAMARLGWSDDAVREDIAELGGIESIIACMKQYPDDDGVQCNGCLAMMALVRGEGDVSNTNKCRVASAGGVECVVAALRAHRQHAMVQLSGLLCLVPLALENPPLQALITDLALPDILLCMRYHPDEVEVVGKAMVALGVLGQGEDPVHETIRDRIVASGAPKAIAGVLSTLGTESEEVLWAALFALAVLVRESSTRYVEQMLALAAAGMLPALRAAMDAYRLDVAAQGMEADEMILKAGDYLTESLEQAETLLRLRRQRRVYLALTLAVAGILGFRAFRRLRASRRR